MDPVSVLALLGLGLAALVVANNRSSNGASTLGLHEPPPPAPPTARVGAMPGTSCGETSFDESTSPETLERDLGGLTPEMQQRVLQSMLDPTSTPEDFENGAKELIAGCSPWIAGSLINSGPQRLDQLVFRRVRLRRSDYAVGANGGGRVGLMSYAMIDPDALALPEELTFAPSPMLVPPMLQAEYQGMIQVPLQEAMPPEMTYQAAPAYAPIPMQPSNYDLLDPPRLNDLAPAPSREIYYERPTETATPTYYQPSYEPTYQDAPTYEPPQLINSPPQYRQPTEQQPPTREQAPPGGYYTPPGSQTRFRLPSPGQPPVPLDPPAYLRPPPPPPVEVEAPAPICCPRAARRLWIVSCEMRSGLGAHVAGAAGVWSVRRGL